MPRPSPGRRPRANRLAGLALALLVPLSAGCQSPGVPSAAPERLSRGDAQVTLASHPVPTKVGIHRVFGRLPVARRKAVRKQVGKVVDRWWDAAYLGGATTVRGRLFLTPERGAWRVFGYDIAKGAR